MVAELGAGRSSVLVLRGEAGVGKTALLEYLASRASSYRVVRAAGVESEVELPFGGLHQLCAQLGEFRTGVRRTALDTAFGLAPGSAPDRFQVGVAMLNLLAEAAERGPLVCLVDDVQWLDQVSAQTLAFVARRLLAERVALVFAVREPGGSDVLTGLDELFVTGLGYADARALLDTVITGVVDERVRDTFVAETRGNPLALLELHRGLSAGQLASGFGLPGGPGLTSRIEDGFVRRLDQLPPETRLLLLAAAAEPVGDAALLWRAAEYLDTSPDAVFLAESADLVHIGARVRFRHPLIRSAVYGAASPAEQRRVHNALALATDAEVDPDRRAWHRAYATAGLDEEVAAELESAAGRAQARGGAAAAAACLERASELTPDPGRRATRALAAAAAKFRAGEPDAADALLTIAALGPTDELQAAHAARLRAQLAFARQRGGESGTLLLEAANRLADLDDRFAPQAYLEALGAAVFAGRLGAERSLEKVAAAARAARQAAAPAGPMDLLLDAVATQFTDGYNAAVPSLRRALHDFRDAAQRGDEQVVQWLWRGCPVAAELWDDDAWHDLSCRGLELARGLGALGVMPGALTYRAALHLHAGEFVAANLLLTESDSIAASMASAPAREARFLLEAWRGDEETALASIELGVRDARARGEGRALSLADHAAAVLYNGLRHYDKAMEAARSACAQEDLGIFGWSLAEWVEAAVRSGAPSVASDALQRLRDRTSAAGTDWALGILARSAALLADGRRADDLYQEAIERLSRTRMAVHKARAHLLYGEWLRRQDRRQVARDQLRTAHDSLSDMGAVAFAERARLELAATGEKARTRSTDVRQELTAQEAQIAHLAAAGLTNAEIATELFLSRHTVDWHLRKVFTKLAVRSRRQLAPSLIDAASVVEA
ncbi:DNA-binding CsgD family transcriptional regulator [Kribbella shirazensis]|uniref:DNA-binding CsgD family transcriptional regulator n=2 Tax=Kribbella shirazensis TaxID=1105143 RepID=A0A7X5VHT9_9ACTN|nr:DNA-binding CsgD family transcriptional regulator [Kribbella shirazensis]